MGVNDGSVLGKTKVLNNGADTSRYNIVLLAEGFKSADQAKFNTAVDSFVAALKKESGISQYAKAINVHRINVSSTDSGADDPKTCKDGTGAVARTYFDATFCNNGIRRLLCCNKTTAISVLDKNVPQWHIGICLVNTTTRGGAGQGLIATSAMSSDWIEVVLHELGHSGFGLADEYNYWSGCGIDKDRNVAPAGEPTQPNVTAAKTRATIKWKNLIAASTPVPTMKNPNCANCDERANPLSSSSIIGLYEGAKYFHCGLFRPSYVCKMRKTGVPFCAVCKEAIKATLAHHMPPVIIASKAVKKPSQNKPLHAQVKKPK